MDPFIILIPIAIGLFSALVAYHLGSKLGGKSLAMGLGLIALVALGLLAGANRASGYDGLALMIFLIFGTGPAAIGVLFGGLIGCFRGSRTTAPL